MLVPAASLIHEASQHVGEVKCVTGKVLHVKVGDRGVHFVGFCEDQAGCPFRVVVFAADLKDVSDVRRLEGRVIEIHGPGKALQRTRRNHSNPHRAAHRWGDPDLSDWIEAGKVLARLAVKYDYEKIGRSRLPNDALIAMSAARMGIGVITANARDFHRLAEFRTCGGR